MRATGVLLLLGASLSIAGCGGVETPPSVPPTPAQTAAPPPAPAAPIATAPDGEAVAPSDPSAAGPADVPADDSANRVKAEAGVGRKGRGYGGGVITAAIKAKFTIEQRVVFEIQIPHAMDLYKATNNRLPRSHEEFMRDIIQANNIQLPELPAGDKYLYDPKLGELMVEQATQ